MARFTNVSNPPALITVTDIQDLNKIYFQPGSFYDINDVLAGQSVQLKQLISAGLLVVTKDDTTSDVLGGTDVITRQELVDVVNSVVVTTSSYLVNQIPTGNKNGINTTFLLPNGDTAKPGTCRIMLNGIRYANADAILLADNMTISI